MQKSILWEGIANDTEEHCSVNFLDAGIMVRSEIEGWSGTIPVYAEYIIRLDLHWNVLEFEIEFHVSDHQHSFHLILDALGNWRDKNGTTYPEFKGYTYVDISLSPFTNSLPINGLGMAVGESREFGLIYIDVMEARMMPDSQKYTKLSNNSYRFENAGGNFTAEIAVDDDGFVTDYPGLFIMFKPQ